jgi:hypothetical protein
MISALNFSFFFCIFLYEYSSLSYDDPHKYTNNGVRAGSAIPLASGDGTK